jgi:Site-specific recombinase XerD
MDKLVVNYIEYIKLNKLSKNTIEAYSRDLRMFYNYLIINNIKFSSMDNMIFSEYIKELKKNGKAQTSIVRSIISIRNFYKYLIRYGYVNEICLFDYEIPKVNRSNPYILTIDEVNKLLEVPDVTTTKGIRDSAMLELMYATGIKVSELLDLNVNDINLKLNFVKCCGTKSRERVVPLGTFSVECLKKYMNIRDEYNINNSGYLFLNYNGEKMTRQGFWKLVKFYAVKAGIKNDITINTIRHSFAVHLIQNGIDIKSLQEMLGYVDINAAQIYINMVNNKKLAEEYKKSHPRA